MAPNWSVVVAGMMLVDMTTTTFYLITVYTPTFGKTVLKLSAADGLIVTICVGRLELLLAADLGVPCPTGSGAVRSCCAFPSWRF